MSYRKALLEGLEVHGQMGLFGIAPLPTGFELGRVLMDKASTNAGTETPKDNHAPGNPKHTHLIQDGQGGKSFEGERDSCPLCNVPAPGYDLIQAEDDAFRDLVSRAIETARANGTDEEKEIDKALASNGYKANKLFPKSGLTPDYDLIDVSLTAIEDSQYYEVGYQAEVKSGPRTGLLCTGSDYDNCLKVMAHKLGVSVDLLNVVEFG